MFKGIKNKSINKAIVNHIKKRQSYLSQIKLNKIAVIVDARKEIDVVSLVRFSSEFNIEPQNFSVIGLKTVKSLKDHVETDSNRIYYDESHFSISGDFNTDLLKSFVNDETIDVLINFYAIDDPYLNLVAAASKAKFKVGFMSVNNEINDLVLGIPENKTDLFVSELKKYLKILEIV